MSTVIIGLGNPLRADDSVGLTVARLLRDRLQGKPGIDVTELWAGGLRLAEAMVGYDRAFVIDAMSSGSVPPGTVRRLALADLGSARNATCVHDTSFPTALELCRRAGASIPSHISFWGIEARDTESFSEVLSDDVARAVPEAAEAILRELIQPGGGES
ncbi:MAG TPA: hydrogenase maturation protease [bacterium]|nr:hydrogenase maturation protease [bacterium]